MQKALLGILIGFGFSVIIAPFVIKIFTRLKNGQPILQYVESHFVKSGTPTMGGVIFLFGSLMTYFVFINDNIRLATLCVATMFGYGLLGFLDDFIKVKYKHNEGLKAYQKALGQGGISVLLAIFVYQSSLVGSGVIIPFTSIEINLGFLIIPFVIFIYLAVTNSVNLIDGLDGLAGSMSVLYLIGFMIAIVLKVASLESAGGSVIEINELKSILTVCGGVVGSLLAFLCFNSHPAKIFMGDTGSLALGGFIATATILTKMYLYFPFLGIMFVLTTISVAMQVLYYKATKKRIFLMAPLHHHFEKKGSNETKIVAIYIIVTMLTIIATLAFIV